MRAYLLILALLLAACAEKAPATLSGYVEAELIYLAPQDAGVVKTLSVREGDRVAAGDIVFTLDPTRLSIAAAQAAAAAQSAEARASEQGAMAQQIAEAEAALRLAEQNYRRSNSLLADDAVSREQYDAHASAYASAKARLERARAERAAMQREWDSMTAAAKLAEKRLADLETAAPAAGSIERIYRRPGEVVAPGDPVVALLPPENLKLRFFAPETMLAKMQIGAALSFSCDACTAGRTAKISYVASEPQFTPPVIYSIDEREKLVFLIEARPEDPSGLRTGLPVTIEPPQ
jgi:HlyD family secretion protein